MSAEFLDSTFLKVLQGFSLSAGRRGMPLILSVQRLLAFLALQDRQGTRAYAAASPWPQTPATKADANLRSRVWRAQRAWGSVICLHGRLLSLVDEVEVDVTRAAAQARRLLSGGSDCLEVIPPLRGDLLA